MEPSQEYISNSSCSFPNSFSRIPLLLSLSHRVFSHSDLLLLSIDTMSQRRAVHKWTTSDRELLALLKTRHSRKIIAPVFNYLLLTRLAKEGFRNGVSAPSLDAQFGEMKAGGNGFEIYARIDNLLEDEIKTKYRGQLSQINLAIQTLGLKVQSSSRILKAKAKAKQKNSPKIRKRRMNRAQGTETISTSPEPEIRSNLVRSRLQ